MPKGKFFVKPEIAPIVRDNQIVRPSLTGRSPQEIPQQIEVPLTDAGITGEKVQGVDPFSIWVNQILDRAINRSIVVETEAIALQRQIISQMDLSLVDAPNYIVEIANSLIETPAEDSEEFSNVVGKGRTELTECEANCVATLAGLYGEVNDLGTEYEKAKKEATNSDPVNDFKSRVKNIGPKVTGLWLFFFMVRFIVAYAVHVSLGFLCCYLRNKLKIKIGPFRVKFGIIIARPIGELERILKSALGFPCSSPNSGECFKPGETPTENQFSIFPCCQPNWESCGSRSEDSEASLAIPNFANCFKRGVSDILNSFEDNPRSDRTRKPCSSCETSEFTQREKEAANALIQYLLVRNQALTDTLSEGKSSNIPFYNSAKAADAINTSRTVRTSVTTLKSSFNENYEYNATFTLNGRGAKCGLDIEGANPFSKLSNYGDLTQEDIFNSFKNNVDTDFTDELRKLEAKETTIVFDGSEEPEAEPFKSIYKTVKAIDDNIGTLLNEFRKTITSSKMLSGLLTDRTFCCVVYAIVVVGNLVKYKKICPDKDIAELFDYAQDFGDNKDVQKILEFLRLLEKLIEALNAELAQDMEFTGIGLPLGTMLELLKKGISQSLVTLLAIALAPIDGALTELENQPRIKALLNDNCFGVGDLLNMLHCGIKWIYDLIKKWSMELIPWTARNIELLGNFRITGFKMAFLLKLQELIKLLIDLLTGIGDCYPPENVALAIMNKLPDQEQGPAPQTIVVGPVPPKAGAGISNFEVPNLEIIGNKVVDLNGNEVFPDTRAEMIEEYKRIVSGGDNTASFPIFSEAIKIGFVQLIEKRNGLNLAVVDAPLDDFFSVNADPVTRVDISKSREEILSDVLNMVENLKSFK